MKFRLNELPTRGTCLFLFATVDAIGLFFKSDNLADGSFRIHHVEEKAKRSKIRYAGQPVAPPGVGHMHLLQVRFRFSHCRFYGARKPIAVLKDTGVVCFSTRNILNVQFAAAGGASVPSHATNPRMTSTDVISRPKLDLKSRSARP